MWAILPTNNINNNTSTSLALVITRQIGCPENSQPMTTTYTIGAGQSEPVFLGSGKPNDCVARVTSLKAEAFKVTPGFIENPNGIAVKDYTISLKWVPSGSQFVIQ